VDSNCCVACHIPVGQRLVGEHAEAPHVGLRTKVARKDLWRLQRQSTKINDSISNIIGNSIGISVKQCSSA
jgi:hypothetical protein